MKCLTEHDDHRDVTRPNDALSDMFDALSGTNANAAEDNLMEANLNGPEADLPDASDPLISAATNAGTEERHNGTSAAISDGLAFQPLPSIKVAQDALDAMKKLLKPPRVTGGHYKASGLDDLLQERLLEMKRFLWVYIDPNSPSHGKWIMSSMAVAKSLVIMAPGMKLYLKRTRHLLKKFMRICNQSVNMSERWIWWTSWTQKRCGQKLGIKKELILLQLKDG